MQATFEKILREQTKNPNQAAVNDHQVRVALLAFAGMTLGEIRSETDDDIEAIAKAVRAVRDAIRCGKIPPEVAAQFPDLVTEQLAYAKPFKPGHASPQLLSKLNAATRGLDKPASGRLGHWVDTVKERFAHIMVPLTIRKLAEAVERGEPEAVKLSAQSFGIVSTGKAPMIAQKFEFGASQPERAPVQGNAPFFEDILRRARTKIDTPALQAGDMPDEAEETDAEA